MTELSLSLDDYDGVYSDFDSRSYSKRRISEDFIDELRSVLKYRTEQFDLLALLVDPRLRNPATEAEITSSLQEQLKARLQLCIGKGRKVRTRGTIMLLAGVIISAAETIIAYKLPLNYATALVKSILAPAGWFLLWNGLEFLIYKWGTISKETAFYKTLTRSRIEFRAA